jgi:hypothetical protein
MAMLSSVSLVGLVGFAGWPFSTDLFSYLSAPQTYEPALLASSSA